MFDAIVSNEWPWCRLIILFGVSWAFMAFVVFEGTGEYFGINIPTRRFIEIRSYQGKLHLGESGLALKYADLRRHLHLALLFAVSIGRIHN
jgi:hypothetical protein